MFSNAATIAGYSKTKNDRATRRAMREMAVSRVPVTLEITEADLRALAHALTYAKLCSITIHPEWDRIQPIIEAEELARLTNRVKTLLEAQEGR